MWLFVMGVTELLPIVWVAMGRRVQSLANKEAVSVTANAPLDRD
ncbi:unnamed protein product [Gemmata massiliana]|uniref:Uncharacterized protein n=1 Tax=Gemmata massiliana TaxID=1210884 RepID=A0A6P2D0V1_9BACT|nr:unnamed protein product [Gemmata massiliana]